MGVAEWSDVAKYPVWLAGREIGTAGEAWITPGTLPGTAAGVATPAGFVHQSGGASPKASSGAEDYVERAIGFRPYLSRTDFEHIQALRHTQRQGGLPPLGSPIPRVESWAISAVERNTWTLAGTIFGTAGARTGFHVVPLIEVRDASGVVTATTVPADHPGAATLTIVSGAPATDTEIQVPTTTDTTALVTGDLTADAGGSLLVQYFGYIPVEILSVSRELDGVNRLIDEVSILERPPQKDYESDA